MEEELRQSARLAEEMGELTPSPGVGPVDPEARWRGVGATGGVGRISRRAEGESEEARDSREAQRELEALVQETQVGAEGRPDPEGQPEVEPHFEQLPPEGDTDWETDHPSPLEYLPRPTIRPRSRRSRRQRRRNPSPGRRQPLLEDLVSVISPVPSRSPSPVFGPGNLVREVPPEEQQPVMRSMVVVPSTSGLSADRKKKIVSGGRALPVKVGGVEFGGLVEIPSDQTIDPPPMGCLNCWSPGHGHMSCPEPKGYYCFNCGRKGEDLRSCPRCAPVHLPRRYREVPPRGTSSPAEVAQGRGEVVGPMQPQFIVTIGPESDVNGTDPVAVSTRKRTRRAGRNKRGNVKKVVREDPGGDHDEGSATGSGPAPVSSGASASVALDVGRVQALKRLVAALRSCSVALTSRALRSVTDVASIVELAELMEPFAESPREDRELILDTALRG